MRLSKVLPFVVLSALISGCTGGTTSADAPKTAPTTSTEKPAKDGIFKVALLTPGPVSDSGWSAMAYDGLNAVKDEMAADVKNQEATGPGDIKDAMRAYAQNGFNLVIGHGYEYNEPESQIAADFPKTVFISSSGGKFGLNFGAFRFELEQGCYLAGVLAATMSKTGTVAMVGGPNVPSIQSTFDAFKAGAVATRSDIKVLQGYTGKDSDIAAAKQLTESMIAKGADFVIHQTNAAAQGVFDACKEKNVWALGTNADQNDNSSGAVIASAIIVARPAFLGLARAVKDGKYKGEIRKTGMAEGAIDFIINPALKDKVPADLQKKIDGLKADIKSGKLQVPMAKF